jgi:hypothetical protein
MKKVVVVALMAVIGISAFTKQKEYTLTEGQAQILFQSMQISAKALPSSDAISARDASMAIQGLDSIARVLAKQSRDTAR